jgi:hypothetical protein
MQIIASYIMVMFIAGWSVSALNMQTGNTKTTKIEFDVFTNEKLIGSAIATKIKTGNTITESLEIKTETRVLLMDVRVESNISLVFINRALKKGIARRHANMGNENVESQVIKTDAKTYRINWNGEQKTLKTGKIDYCVVDLYFIEPKHKKYVFSTMYAQYLQIIHEGHGRYKTILPDKKDAVYIYKNGRLETIEVDIPLGKVITKRRVSAAS